MTHMDTYKNCRRLQLIGKLQFYFQKGLNFKVKFLVKRLLVQFTYEPPKLKVLVLE